MAHEHDIKPIKDPKDIPANLSDEEQIEFLMTHGVSEEFLDNTKEALEDERPRPRTRPINVRFDDFTLQRLKNLAGRRNMGYQTLLKDFVMERLYEEEKREGVLYTTGAREAVGTLSKEATNAFAEFLNSALSFYQEAVRESAQVAQENVQQEAAEATQQNLQEAVRAGQQAMEAATKAEQQSAEADN
jgi:predicted DNA binding CopG/RHH family protein